MSRRPAFLPLGTRPAPVLGVTLAALLAVTTGASLQRSQASDSLDLTAVFADVGPLIAGNEVKIGGVTAGKVDSIELVNGKAQVGLTVAPEFLPLHRDATAFVKPVSLLGERYVDLDPGSAQAPLLSDGAVLPVEQTGRLTDLDEVLDVVDKPTGEALAAALTTLGLGVAGNGEAARVTLDRLPAALGDADRLVGVLAEQNSTLNALVDAVTPVAESLGAERGARLDGLVQGASDLLGSTAAQQDALRRSLQLLPQTLQQAQARLASLTGTATAATPLLRDVRPVTSDLQDISRELQALGQAADPALASLQPVLERARQLVEEARPVAADLSAASPALASVARDARPIALALIGDDDKLANLLEFVRNWALTTNGKDGLSHYFRAHVIVSEESLMGPIPVDTPVKDITKDLPPVGTGTPAGAVPNVGGVLGDIADGAGSGLGGLVSPASPQDPGSATGLTPEQEQGLLGTLLGAGR